MADKLDRLMTEEQKQRLLESGHRRMTVYQRVISKGWSVDEAIDTPIDPKFTRNKGHFIWGGVKVSAEQVEAAKQNGINTETLRARVTNGMSIEKAITKKLERRTREIDREKERMAAADRWESIKQSINSPQKQKRHLLKISLDKPVESPKWKIDPYYQFVFDNMFKRWA